MITVRNFISASLILCVLTQCSSDKGNIGETEIGPGSGNRANQNSVIGEWKHKSTIWYSSELILQENGNFRFHRQGCFGHNFSEGHWIQQNGRILLTSFPEFKEEEGAERKQVEEIKKEEDTLENAKATYTFIGTKTFKSFKIPGPNDTLRIYFDKVQLQLKNDTLCPVSTGHLAKKEKFYRFNKNL